MPEDEIDLGDGVTAEFIKGRRRSHFVIADESTHDNIALDIEAARKFCRFVEERVGKD